MTSIEDRLQRIEDQLDIYQVISRYGPAADAGSTADAVALWKEDGVYEVGGVGKYTGHDEIAGLLESDLHQGYIRNGSAHLLSLPHVILKDGSATAVNYAQLALRTEDGFQTTRIVASRWELARSDGTWKVTSRKNVLLDGAQAGRDLLEHSLKG